MNLYRIRTYHFLQFMTIVLLARTIYSDVVPKSLPPPPLLFVPYLESAELGFDPTE